MAAQLKVIDNGMASTTEKQKALDAALAQIDRAFGKGSAMKLGSREAIEIEAISTGSLGLDIALGIGGLPRGRAIEAYGPASSAKPRLARHGGRVREVYGAEMSGTTPLALHGSAAAPKLGATAAFVDAGRARDRGYARSLCVAINELSVSQPDTGEQALRIVDTLVRSNAID